MKELKSNGHTVYQPAADADTSILRMALDVTELNENNVIVIASDMDILVLLVHHFTAHVSDICIQKQTGMQLVVSN
jgi:hypothetical protein